MQQRTLRADVGSIRAIWAIQDKLALDAEEEKAIELKRELVGGQERMIWNPSTSIAAQMQFIVTLRLFRSVTCACARPMTRICAR